MSSEKEIKSELLRFSSLMNREEGKEAWHDLKHIENYVEENRHYPMLSAVENGNRIVLVPKSLDNNKDVQTTRTLNVADKSVEELEESFEISPLGGNDISRIWELDNFLSSFKTLERCVDVVSDVPSLEPKKFCEIGFRNLKLMRAYEEKYDIPVMGYDICKLSVEMAKRKGYDARYADLNTISLENNLDLSGCNLVVCYHVLEHLMDPLTPLANIFAAMDDLTVFHVEVPLEPFPNYEYGHLFPFRYNDLENFVASVGLEVLATTYHESQTVDGSYVFARVIGVKGYDKINIFFKEQIEKGILIPNIVEGPAA